MKRVLNIAAGVALAAALQTGAAHAQMNLTMRHNVNNDTTNAFGCATACATGGVELRCNAFRRIWSDFKPSQVNSVSAPVTECLKDGFPRWASAPLRLVGDAYLTSNYVDSNPNPCEAWMSAWDAVLTPATDTFITFYGMGTSLANFSETGNAFCSNCLIGTDPGYGTTCNTQGQTIDNQGLCFGALGRAGQPASPAAGAVIAGGAVAADNSPFTPRGADLDADPELETRGGLEPVPVPRIVSSDTAGRTMVVAWDAADNQVNVNRPGTVACPGAATFGNELSATVAPSGISGTRLFVHGLAGVEPNRTLADIEGSTVTAGVLGVFGNLAPASSYCNTDGAGGIPGTACPGMHIIPCNATGVTGGVCAPNGIDFSPAAQSVTLSEAAVNAALGTDGPLGTGDVGVLNIKVVFSGATDAYSSSGDGFLNPDLVSLFSAHSTRFGFQGLVSSVQFDSSATVVRGNRVTLSWSTVGGPFTEFLLERALDGVGFQEVAVIPGGAQPTYTFTDEIRGRASASIWYRLVYTDVSGGAGQALIEVSLRGEGRR